MTKIKKMNYSLLSIIFCSLFIVLCSLFAVPVQSQTPKIVTLTWSTNTYVPPDYPGKALPVKGSVIEVVANIDSKELNPQSLTYRWFLNDHLQREKSGLGKSVLKFPVNWRAENEQFVRVEVRNEQENLLGSGYLDIGIVEPQIIIKPTAKNGVFPLESSIFSIIKKYQVRAEQEISFIAQPYFFNIKDINGLDYQWSFGEKRASQISEDNPNAFTLEIGKIAQSIKQNLKIWAENKNNALQGTRATAEIIIIP